MKFQPITFKDLNLQKHVEIKGLKQKYSCSMIYVYGTLCVGNTN